MLRYALRMLFVAVLIVLLSVPSKSVSAINVTLDYTYDSTNFFGSGNPGGAAAGAQARAALDAAAGFYSDLLVDTFSIIETPNVFFSQVSNGRVSWSWSLSFLNPSSGSSVSLVDQTIAADEYRIYVGARNLTGSTLGVGGPGGFGWSNNPSGSFSFAELDQLEQITEDFSNTVEMRGESTGFARWGGALTFDRDNDWSFNHIAPPVSGDDDFYSVAIHEMGHVLGLGTSDNWNSWINSGNNYNGPKAVAEYGGVVPLACNPGCGHWAEGTESTVLGTTTTQEAAMDPSIFTGTRKLLTALDAAALEDIGWSVEVPIVYATADYDTDGDVDANDLGTLQNWFGINANGDADGDMDTDGADLLTWQRQYTGQQNLSDLAAVPEPTSVCLFVFGTLLVRSRRMRVA